MKTRLVAIVMSAAALGALHAEINPPLPAAGNVTLPIEDYNKLVELAARPVKKPDTPPVPYVLKSAHMNLEVNGDSVSGSTLIEGEVLAAGDRKVPLVSGMIVLDAQRQGAELPLAQENGTLSALLHGPGEFAVTLTTGVRLTIETGRASFTLPAPAAGAVLLTLSVPGEHTALNLSPGLITARASGQGRTTIDATLVPGQPANLWWAARLTAPPVAPKQARFLSDVKTLISVRDAEIAVVALAEVTVVQGEPAQFVIVPPEGYELTGATGPTLIASDVEPKAIRLRVGNAAARTHQFLISLAKSDISTKAEIPLITFDGTQRETGEVLVEGEGAMELSASERGGLRRMDMKETSPYLRSLARASLHAAFRYQKRPAELPALALEWTRFPDSNMLSAVAQSAVVTTLVTTEGRSLTEVKLTVKNQSQPFLKVGLPPGASILSATVAGDKVKPVEGADGNRVPLLRPGFRPSDSYEVSFVFLHAGLPFSKKGAADLALPPLDIPVGVVEWEVFLPKQFKVSDFGGDAISARLLENAGQDAEESPIRAYDYRVTYKDDGPLLPGQIGGVVTDPSGALVPRANVQVVLPSMGRTWNTSTDLNGHWRVSEVPSGHLRITVVALGYQTLVRDADHDAVRGTPLSVALQVASVNQTVTVTAVAPGIQTSNAEIALPLRDVRQNAAKQNLTASANVSDLQRRVSGVLPITVKVPRTGNAYRFIRPLVVGEETRLTFNYRKTRQ